MLLINHLLQQVFSFLLLITRNITKEEYKLYAHNSLIPLKDYTHVMSGLMKYYIKPFFAKDDPERRFWIQVFRTLYFSLSAFESDVILFQMFIYGLAQRTSTISRSKKFLFHFPVFQKFHSFYGRFSGGLKTLKKALLSVHPFVHPSVCWTHFSYF